MCRGIHFLVSDIYLQQLNWAAKPERFVYYTLENRICKEKSLTVIEKLIGKREREMKTNVAEQEVQEDKGSRFY